MKRQPVPKYAQFHQREGNEESQQGIPERYVLALRNDIADKVSILDCSPKSSISPSDSFMCAPRTYLYFLARQRPALDV